MADRGRLWIDAETKALLHIWGQDSIQRQLSGAVCNYAVFMWIMEELAWQEFRRSIQQCQAKPKPLRKKHKEVVDKAKASGADNESDEEGGPILSIKAKLMLS